MALFAYRYGAGGLLYIYQYRIKDQNGIGRVVQVRSKGLLN